MPRYVMGIVGAILLLVAACGDQRTSTPVTVATAITAASVAPTPTDMPIPTKTPTPPPSGATEPPTPTKAVSTATAIDVPSIAAPTKAPPTPAPLGRTRDNPFPFGQPATISSKDKGELIIAVAGVVHYADDTLKSYNAFNKAAQPGNKWLLVLVAVKNNTKGTDVVKVTPSSFAVVGSSARIINPAFAVVKREVRAELFEGGLVDGEIPFEVPANETNLLLIYDAASLGGQRYYFALE